MKLKSYLSHMGIKQGAFADQIGVRPATVSRWTNSKRHPSAKLLRKIYEGTHGAVTPTDFMPPAE